VALCFGPLGGRIVALVKPQFEAGKGQTQEGVVRDPRIHKQTLEAVARYALGIGLKLRNAVASPLTGPAGNREFFMELEVPAGFVAADGGPVDLPEEWVSKFAELAGA
jgi:23S rRNA (cytidine1920-2'-O)/16S rRNA (cytidine1409-2'-O)-methyltransferase